MKNAYTRQKENPLICYEGVLLIWNISIDLKSCLVLEGCNSGGAKKKWHVGGGGGWRGNSKYVNLVHNLKHSFIFFQARCFYPCVCACVFARVCVCVL